MHNRRELPENPRVSLLVLALARMLERGHPVPKVLRAKQASLPLFEEGVVENVRNGSA